MQPNSWNSSTHSGPPAETSEVPSEGKRIVCSLPNPWQSHPHTTATTTISNSTVSVRISADSSWLYRSWSFWAMWLPIWPRDMSKFHNTEISVKTEKMRVECRSQLNSTNKMRYDGQLSKSSKTQQPSDEMWQFPQIGTNNIEYIIVCLLGGLAKGIFWKEEQWRTESH